MSEVLNSNSETSSDNETATAIGDVVLGGAVTYLDAPYEVIEYVPGDSLPKRVNDEYIKNDLHRELLRRRQSILELSSQEEGIDMTRLDAFRQSIGARRVEIRVLSPEDFDKAKRVESTEGDSNRTMGRYFTLEDVVIVEREPHVEKEHGTGVVESLIAHEIAHSSSDYNTLRMQKELRKRLFRRDGLMVNLDKARSGFAVSATSGESLNEFLEEAYAEYERGHYVTDYLQLPNGFIQEPLQGSGAKMNKYFLPVLMDGKVVDKSLAPGGGPAALLELLIDNEPDLLPALRKARQSPEGLREVARIIDAQVPGLYAEMRKANVGNMDDVARIFNLYTKATQMEKAA